ncbi:hypothetical protein FNV43_RR18717 [Rhamnella rubrinervis]|uniref:Uncharacterized protein n=1 Tax=Rhamnella rubrinervis TaxID=2594499 RepID=A0A8K0E5M2_9ROSA|nr:hypothetical protein FNV43_RR18717 [Rhamnella rubrinervis]
MTDIAILVAEEFERRVSDLRKVGRSSEAEQEMDLFSSVSAMAQTLKKKIAQQNLDFFVKWTREPKTQISLAAYSGFFSA